MRNGNGPEVDVEHALKFVLLRDGSKVDLRVTVWWKAGCGAGQDREVAEKPVMRWPRETAEEAAVQVKTVCEVKGVGEADAEEDEGDRRQHCSIHDDESCWRVRVRDEAMK